MMAALTMRRILRSSGERGSILLITLISVALVTLLGLAVYDLATIEGQFSAASLIDYRAYEIAQAGIERGIRELRNVYIGGVPGSETFVDFSPGCIGGCDATQFRVVNNLVGMTIPAQTSSTAPFIATDPGGTYTLELKYLTMAEANNSIDAVGLTYPFGLECSLPPGTAPATWCPNLAFLRSSGTTTDAAGNTRTRTIQTLVKASSTSVWAGGIIGGNGNLDVSGEVLIAGTVHVLGAATSNPAVNISGGADAGMRNNWFALDPASGYAQSEAGGDTLGRLNRKQLICPAGSACAGATNLVESLGAEIKIFGNITNSLFTTGASTVLGQAGPTALYGAPAITGTPARRGKGPLDGVGIADGCALPCTGGSNPFSLGGGSTVTVDRNNLTKPYPNRPPIGPLLAPSGTYPIINDAVTIWDGATATDYAQYYSNWFSTHAASWNNLTVVNGLNCAVPVDCGAGFTLGTILNNGGVGLDRTATKFRHSFIFTDRTGTVQTAEMCWRRDEIAGGVGNTGANLPLTLTGNGAAYTLEFGIPTCATPSGPGNAVAPNIPVMFWYGSPWGIQRQGGAHTISFRGWALAVTNATVVIDEEFVSYCGAVAVPCPQKFPEDHLFAVMTTNGVSVATNNGSVNRVFGYYFAMGNIIVQRDVNVVGMLRAVAVCFRNSAGCGGVGGGGSIPGFFQASFQDQRKIPHELSSPYEVPGQRSGGRWQVTSVPQFWLECRRGPGQALPITASGICAYQ